MKDLGYNLPVMFYFNEFYWLLVSAWEEIDFPAKPWLFILLLKKLLGTWYWRKKSICVSVVVREFRKHMTESHSGMNCPVSSRRLMCCTRASFVSTKWYLLGPQDNIPSMLNQTYLATARIIWSPFWSQLHPPATDCTKPGGNLAHSTACGNNSFNGPSNREKYCSRMHARDYFAGVSVPAIEKTRWCQLCLYTVSLLNQTICVVTCSSKHSCLQCLNNDLLTIQPLRSSKTMCT